MADELDPVPETRLEHQLRAVLRAEAESVPFTLRADTVRRVGAERRRANRNRIGSLLAAAAVIALAIGTAGITLSQRAWQVAAQSPSPSAPASTAMPGDATPDANGLLPYTALRALLGNEGVPTASVQAEHLSEVGDGRRSWTAGTVEVGKVVVAVSCSGAPLTLSVMVGAQQVASMDDQCTGKVQMEVVAAEVMAAYGAPGQVVVEGPGSARWRVAAGVVLTAVATVAPPSASTADLPSSADLLAAAGQGEVRLQALESNATAQDRVVRFDPVPDRGALAMAIACTGGDSVGVAFSSDPLPSSDPGGDASPFHPVTCDGTAQVSSVDGWNALFLDTGYQVGLSVPAGVSYRAILVDTSAVAADGEATPVSDGLPSFTHLSAVHWDDEPGLVIATQEHLGPAGDAGAPVQAADIRAADTAFVLVTCLGGTADVAVGGGSEAAVSLGKPSCDGTVQRLQWTRGDGPQPSSVLVTATPGTSWRVVVRGVANTHPKSAVPCGSEAGLRTAPLATLYQGGTAVQKLPSYFASSWGSTHDDGVPSIPASVVDVAAGQPLQLRIAVDVCSAGWMVLYGTPGAGGTGVDPLGALAFDGGSVTTVIDHENRIDLASLPPGDWVLQIELGFDKGHGTALLRVHAS